LSASISLNFNQCLVDFKLTARFQTSCSLFLSDFNENADLKKKKKRKFSSRKQEWSTTTQSNNK
jgi:hypothetical protein